MENRIYKIKEKCDEILSFNMWFNLNDSFFLADYGINRY